jgi:hypothetical protein
MKAVAQSWLVLELTDSPFPLGLVGALQFTPILFLSILAGPRCSPGRGAGAPRGGRLDFPAVCG